ncbi:MAG: hypothetical protein PHW04_06450 [Candidatus Wallbacteria bacterium]|nr:hypothetical protein [Candidatus Wallbacteria bacterium]
MKKGFLFLLVLLSLTAFAYSFLTVKEVLASKTGKFVSVQGTLLQTDYIGQYLFIQDKTGTIKVDLHSDDVNYFGYDKLGVQVKAWGYVCENASEKYIKARKIQVGGHFYYSN